MRYVFTFLAGIVLCVSQSVYAGTITRSYKWNYNGKLYSTSLTFDDATYKYYKGVRREYYDFTVYTKEHNNYPVVKQVATALKNIAEKNNLNEWQTVEFISAFVQHLRYVGDGKYEYPRYPAETLVEMSGDCEDTAILLTSLLMSLGYKSVLISPKGHMGTGIAVKGKYPGVSVPYDGMMFYYIETTEPGWNIGDYPQGLTEDANILDPGIDQFAKLLNYNGNAYKTQSPSTKTVTASAQASTPENKSAYQFKESYVLTTDVVIIDGKQEMVVTKVEY